ncbi:MAG: hypothetical protein ACTTJ3_09260 [Treponema sp.]
MPVIIGFIIWVFLCALTAVIAERKGHKALRYCFLSMFLTPLVGLIVVACISNRNKKECPFCCKSIDIYASVCGYCGKELKKKNPTDSKRGEWISKRTLELINEGKSATDAKIQAEAEYSVNNTNQTDTNEIK